MFTRPLSGIERVLEVVGGLGGWMRDQVRHQIVVSSVFFNVCRLGSLFSSDSS